MVALGVLGFLVFLLKYCWGGSFKNFKLLEKIEKLFAVFADNLDRVGSKLVSTPDNQYSGQEKRTTSNPVSTELEIS